MSYLKVIDATQTWVCPKTADYKIICVAGGGGGNCSYNAQTPEYFFGIGGSPTSFGNLLTASGSGSSGGDGSGSGLIAPGGGGGYTFADYGGNGSSSSGSPATKNGGAAHSLTNPPSSIYSTAGHTMGSGSGYGGGGGGCGGSGGNGGRLVLLVTTIAVGVQIPCTIGSGGAGAMTPSNWRGAKGNDGVIVIQEV